MPAQNWNVDRTLKNRGAAKAFVSAAVEVPLGVRVALTALIDELPVDREDCTVKVATSGHLGDWAEWSAMPRPSALVGGGVAQAVPPKPSGHFSLWVGYSNQPAD